MKVVSGRFRFPFLAISDTYDVSTGLSGLLGDSPTNSSVTSSDDDSLL